MKFLFQTNFMLCVPGSAADIAGGTSTDVAWEEPKKKRHCFSSLGPTTQPLHRKTKQQSLFSSLLCLIMSGNLRKWPAVCKSYCEHSHPNWSLFPLFPLISPLSVCTGTDGTSRCFTASTKIPTLPFLVRLSIAC